MYMAINELNAVLPPEDIHRHFKLVESALYRIMADGTLRQLASMDNSKVVTLFKSHRILGVEIAWCLLHGNWPMHPIVQIKRDPHNFAEDNLYPARLRIYRFRATPVQGGYQHGLSTGRFKTEGECRLAWELAVRDKYAKDLPMVLALEADQRKLRETYLADLAAANPKPVSEPAKIRPLPPRQNIPNRPAAVEGMEWHWYAGDWVSVPQAVHTADDYRLRIQKWRQGARRFEYCTERERVIAFDAGGNEV